jgi:predicted GNAT family N-acyltransferase
MIDAARTRGDRHVVLNAQVSATPFYAHHGFVAEGDEFDEAGIAHRAMRLAL